MLARSLWEGKAAIGGSEHDIWEEPGEYWKVTRPDRFGWTVLPGDDGFPVLSEATPIEYLERWSNAVRYFGDQVRLRGVVKSDEGVQVVVSQAYIEGPYPRKEEIIRDMLSRGFSLVPRFSIGAECDSSFYHLAERVAVFDAAADNFILSQGVPIPVDVVTLIPADKLHRQLLALIFGR